MPHKYVDWFTVRPPRTDSLVNLNKLVAACDAMGATHPGAKQTPYAVAKKAGVNVSQAGRLMLRPGFVSVMHKGEAVGVYWDRANFGNKYPTHYVDLTKLRVLSEYDLTPEETLGEKAASARQIESMVESATGKLVPVLFERPLSEGKTLVEYRVTFNAIDDATIGDERYLGAVRSVAVDMLKATEAEEPDLRIIRDSLEALMNFTLAVHHNEKSTPNG